MRGILLTTLVILLTAGGYVTAGIAWQTDGLGICTAVDSQETPCVVSFGASGALFVWADRRNGSFDIYAQRVDASGQPLWTAGGIAVCTAAYDQQFPAAVSDGAGGVIVVWQDGRLGDDGVDLYAQRITAAGSLAWQAGGIPVCIHNPLVAVPPIAFSHVVTSDGTGGAIVAWRDNRNDPELGNTEIYAQKITGAGSVAWTTNGVRLVDFGLLPWPTRSPAIAPDGAGGAFVVWQDGRSATTNANDIYAQRVTSSGTPAWTANGIAVCSATGEQGYLDATTTPHGDLLVVWEDKRSGNYDVYAQRMSLSGAPQWGANGTVVVTASNDQRAPRVVIDSLGGIVIAWADGRFNSRLPDVYAQKLDAAGAPQWISDGVAACGFSCWKGRIRIAPGDAGSTLLTWTDNRVDPSNTTYYYDIYSQLLNSLGAPQWQSAGIAVCAAQGTQRLQQVAPDGNGGAYVVWEDNRNAGDWDVYAQRATPVGSTQAVSSIAEVKALHDGLRVSLPALAVSACFQGFFYVQEQDRSAGIRVVSSASVTQGQQVAVIGDIETSSERYIQAIEVTPVTP